jgi:predicted RND superfamily exporter protein
VVVLALIVSAVALFGIFKIRINDNPTKWFKASHPIRVADRVLNEHFGGTYMAYLALEAVQKEIPTKKYAGVLTGRLDGYARRVEENREATGEIVAMVRRSVERLAERAPSREALLEELVAFGEAGRDEEEDDDRYFAWEEVLLFLEVERGRDEAFKQPEVLRYVAKLQEHMEEGGVVGKTNALTDIVKTVLRELFDGDEAQFRIPDTPAAVAQCLETYLSSHRPNDLWHFVTPDFRKTVVWCQLKSGDNIDMSRTVEAVDRYLSENPPPLPLRHQWFGLTYINVVWQEKMVSGMLEAFFGSFLIVFLMMTLVFRSALWGFLSMIPLTVTIGLIYGIIGLVGKDYDMPVAVLSSLSIGLAVDYAIHFLARSRMLREEHGTWARSVGPVFGEPARAIARNVVVVGVGFLPLLAAPLVPYKTVGIFIAAILFAAGLASLLILPALITLLEGWLFPASRTRGIACRCGTCIIAGIGIVALVAINIHQFLAVGWNRLIWPSMAIILVLAGVCFFTSRTRWCRTDVDQGERS